ncbi:exodeoxyribonuclease VII large subunit [Mycobacteroides abscessus subsp. abscessus]|nr:exodeoxyribonuclease VII large subunit [Mycobacteroides abscessus subsp. abscessus]
MPQLTEEIVKIEQVYLRLLKGYQRKVERADERLKHSLNSYVFRQPQRLYEGYTQNVDMLSERLGRVMTEKVTLYQQDLKKFGSKK